MLAILLLTSKGAAGVTGSGFITLAATLPRIPSIPSGGLALLVGVDRFMSEARAITNLIGNAVATVVIARWDGALDLPHARRVLAGDRPVPAIRRNPCATFDREAGRVPRYQIDGAMSERSSDRSSCAPRWSSVLSGRRRRLHHAQLPDGPGKDAVVKVCGTCHEPNRAAALRLTREGWEQTVADMRWRGAKGTDEEFAAVIEYLVANFLGEAPAKLNMNRATAVELESVVLLLRKEAARSSRIATRSGGFKSIDDIKKTPGVDIKKIEAAKDRITF